MTGLNSTHPMADAQPQAKCRAARLVLSHATDHCTIPALASDTLSYLTALSLTVSAPNQMDILR